MPLQRLLDRAGPFAGFLFQRLQNRLLQCFFLLFERTIKRRFYGLSTCHIIAVPCAAPPMLGPRPPVQSVLQCGVSRPHGLLDRVDYLHAGSHWMRPSWYRVSLVTWYLSQGWQVRP